LSTHYEAVIFDLGGVVFPSPFEMFDAYDRDRGLPPGSVRGLIRTSSETGAWAAFERGEHTFESFVPALEAEAASGGFTLDATALIGSIGGGRGARPEMLRAIKTIRERGYKTAALTNNWIAPNGERAPGRFDDLVFDVVVESAVEGIRKPDPRIYELVLERLDAPAENAVFLDDLGINLKPARAMGMTTIKVVDVAAALTELEQVLGFALGGEG